MRSNRPRRVRGQIPQRLRDFQLASNRARRPTQQQDNAIMEGNQPGEAEANANVGQVEPVVAGENAGLAAMLQNFMQ